MKKRSIVGGLNKLALMGLCLTIQPIFLTPAQAIQSQPTNMMQDWTLDAEHTNTQNGVVMMRHPKGAVLIMKSFPDGVDVEQQLHVIKQGAAEACPDIVARKAQITDDGKGRYVESLNLYDCAISMKAMGTGILTTLMMSPKGSVPLRPTIMFLEKAMQQSLGTQQAASAISSPIPASPTPRSNLAIDRAVPRPVGVASTLSNATSGFPPMRTNEQIRWYLFSGGIAHNCDDVDPRTLTMTLQALEAQEDCESARWRKVGNRTELQVDDGDDWEDVSDTLEKPVPKGMRLDAHYVRQGGYSTYNTNVVTSGGVRFTRDGQFQAASSTGFGGNYGAVSAIGSGSSPGLSGTYELDGYILKITSGEEATYRYVYFAPRKGKPYGYIQFEGKLYWDE